MARRRILKERVEKELSEFALKERVTVSKVYELMSASGMTTPAGIYLALSETLGETLYRQWLETPKSGKRTEQELLKELECIIHQENVDFWNEKIDQVSTKVQLAQKLSVSFYHLKELIDMAPKAFLEHHRTLSNITHLGNPIKFRAIILLIRRELSKHRKDNTFVLTRIQTILETYDIHWPQFYRYRNRGLCLSIQKEHTAILRLQYKYIQTAKTA